VVASLVVIGEQGCAGSWASRALSDEAGHPRYINLPPSTFSFAAYC